MLKDINLLEAFNKKRKQNSSKPDVKDISSKLYKNKLE